MVFRGPRCWRQLIVAVGLLVGCSVFAEAPAPSAAATRYLDPTFDVDVQRDIVYGRAVAFDGSIVDLTLDLYTPRGDVETKRPVFVFAHGGFFFIGSKQDSDAVGWATRMAQRGYVAASINYRLSPVPVLAPVDTPGELAAIDNARLDMQTSIRWFRANASALGVDPERIAVGGSSAGAVTALGVAVNRDDPGIGDHPDESAAVCTAVSISGANDPTVVDAGDAGAIFHHGTDDTIVPYDLAVQTRDAMVAAGLPVQWNEYPGEGHSLSSQDVIRSRTIQWLYNRVATAPYPCSASVAQRPRVAPLHQTAIRGEPNRSAVMSIVATDAAGAGYIQLLACGQAPGAASNLNLDQPGQTRAVLAVGRFDASGGLCVFNQPRTHVVVDLQGYFAAGAFDDTVDQRILDTRATGLPAAGSQTEIVGRPNSTGVVSIVMTDTVGPGYVEVLPCGASPGASSNLNADATGQTRAGSAFVRFDASGEACVFTQTPAHLVVDVQGYMSAGAFDDIDDIRLLDTRNGPRPAAGSMSTIVGRPNATGVVSITATETAAPGYVQALACDDVPGESSNLNVDRVDQTVAVLAFVQFDAHGHACVFNQQATHLVVDLQGYMSSGAFEDRTDVRLLDTRVK